MLHPLQILVCVICVFSLANGVHLFVKPAFFYEGDKDVKLICNLIDSSASDFGKAEQMTIQREVTAGRWTTVGSIQSNGDTTQDLGLDVSGFVGRPTESYLMVHFQAVTNNWFGSYRCETIGESPSGSHLVKSSALFTVSGPARSVSNLFDLIRNSDKDIVGMLTQADNNADKVQFEQEKLFRDASAERKTMLDKLASLQTLLEGSVVANISDILVRMSNLETSVKALEEHH